VLRRTFEAKRIMTFMIKRKSVKLAEHVAHLGEKGNAYRILVRKSEGRDHLEDLDLDGRILLN
jgi:hypothetical protein